MKIKISLLFIVVLVSACKHQEDENVISDPVRRGAQIKIISPTDGENLKPGTELKIKWTSSSSIQRVNISLFRKRELKTIISTNTVNTGSYTWKIPSEFFNSMHYRIKISDADFDEIEDLTDYFVIRD